MLRNGWVVANKALLRAGCKDRLQRHISTTQRSARHGTLYAKDTNIGRQGKIMSKLFGARVAGSKKHWYPTQDATATAAASSIFQSSQFGRSSSGRNGKNTSRRMTVLNKLFMKHITDLLATGEASEAIVGRGLQVTRVKTASDFACLNVYWLGSGDVLADRKLEQELQRCSGLLRHELSQLGLMGQVPRIHFVREKLHANLTSVETLLSNMDFGPDDDMDDNDDKAQEHAADARMDLDSHKQIKEEFYGKSETVLPAKDLPEMRQDVLGLDHRDIMTKILAKMRKSKQAWDLHNQGAATAPPTESSSHESERIKRTLEEAADNAERFDKFLLRRRERKNIPERKKYTRAEQLSELSAATGWTASGDASLDGHSPHDDDFIQEEPEQKVPRT